MFFIHFRHLANTDENFCYFISSFIIIIIIWLKILSIDKYEIFHYIIINYKNL